MNEGYLASTGTGSAIVFLTTKIQQMSQDIEIIKTSQQELHTKVDSIKDVFSLLILNIDNLKKEDRDTEEKIILAYRHIDKILAKLDKEEIGQSIEDYESVYKQKLAFWNKLDSLTQKFLCTADFLYSSLQKTKEADFSPAVIEFCRALENELFLRIFKEFILNFIKSHGDKIELLLVDDISKDETRTLAYQVIAGKTGQDFFLTLGQMQFYLYRLLRNDSSGSFILKQLLEFISNNFKADILLNKTTIWGLKDFTDKYRNKAAHPDILNIEHVKESKKVVISYLELIYRAQSSS